MDMGKLRWNNGVIGKCKWAGEKEKEKRKRKKGGGSLNAYFCIGFSQLWREKIHSLIKRLQNAHVLKWIRVRMSYHRFPNLGEVL